MVLGWLIVGYSVTHRRPVLPFVVRRSVRPPTPQEIRQACGQPGPTTPALPEGEVRDLVAVVAGALPESIRYDFIPRPKPPVPAWPCNTNTDTVEVQAWGQVSPVRVVGPVQHFTAGIRVHAGQDGTRFERCLCQVCKCSNSPAWRTHRPPETPKPTDQEYRAHIADLE